ncbi:DNA oxidative demethylase AlkB [Nitrosovibrio sp. Nv17]|uniref:DNA oxidative demethylase AlkB n=1 Tax=Nitrosovibrio sp. Nv17 TaxID=1855339 RepID=UPI0009085125|nr:DNA oxidative demethylase AlkB [Nitrosovibrio sp. Nv17]SFW13578.1 alkylated DNA repair protein (DNA oxidative demethylase) [Nitrosovibrio sp. Nv17]
MDDATPDLFGDVPTNSSGPARMALSPGATVLRGFALPSQAAVWEALRDVAAAAPFRHMATPGGLRMSVASTSCGTCGWVSDHRGYRYDAANPESGGPWPGMPAVFLELAREAAAVAGFDGYQPDTCLINRYEVGARLTLHQDKNERDFQSPIVSVSLGLPAVFLWGGAQRSDRPLRVSLVHGDVTVWGGPARLRFHGVLPIREGRHPWAGACRISLTFRKAG